MSHRTPLCNHSSTTTCIHCMKNAEKEDGIHWMCQHGPGQMCPNCVKLNKGEKVELQILCQHGPNQYCTNCLATTENSDAKHVSFADYIKDEKRLCNHGSNQSCPHCTLPSMPSYKVKGYCRNHQPYPRGLCTSCAPKPCTLNRQKYRHVDSVQVVDKKCMDAFIQEWLNYGERTQMMGLLYGKYSTLEGKNGTREIALVYGIYKPKQRYEDGRIVLEKDEMIASATAITGALELSCIGMIYTAPPRSSRLSSFDVDFVAPLQLAYKRRDQYASKFVTVVLSRNDKKQVEPEAFMLSDQCCCMYRDGLLLPPRKPDMCRSTTAGKNKVLLSTVLRNDAKLGSQEVTEFEPLFFYVELTIYQAKAGNYFPVFQKCEFPCPSSNQETYDTLLKELMAVLREALHTPAVLKNQLSDFYLLVELANVIGIEFATEICHWILVKQPIPDKSIEVLRLMVNSNY